MGFILKRVQSINYSNLAEQRIGNTVVKPDVCVQDEATAYLNMLDVQKAFHARLVGSLKDGMPAASMFGLQNIIFSMPSYQFFSKYGLATFP